MKQTNQVWPNGHFTHTLSYVVSGMFKSLHYWHLQPEFKPKASTYIPYPPIKLTYHGRLTTMGMQSFVPRWQTITKWSIGWAHEHKCQVHMVMCLNSKLEMNLHSNEDRRHIFICQISEGKQNDLYRSSRLKDSDGRLQTPFSLETQHLTWFLKSSLPQSTK